MSEVNYVADSKSWWNSWRTAEILYVEDWKEGVKKLHVRDLAACPPSFYLVYCPNEFLPPDTIARYA